MGHSILERLNERPMTVTARLIDRNMRDLKSWVLAVLDRHEVFVAWVIEWKKACLATCLSFEQVVFKWC